MLHTPAWTFLFLYSFHQLFFFSCVRPFFFFRTLPGQDAISKVMEHRRFVYQNIDLFSLYTSTLALTLGSFLWIYPLGLEGLPSPPWTSSWHCVASEALVGSKRDKRGRAVCIRGVLAPNWQCLGNIHQIGPVQNNAELFSFFCNLGRIGRYSNRVWRFESVCLLIKSPSPRHGDVSYICSEAREATGSQRTKTMVSMRGSRSLTLYLISLLIYYTLQRVIQQVHAKGPLVPNINFRASPHQYMRDKD